MGEIVLSGRKGEFRLEALPHGGQRRDTCYAGGEGQEIAVGGEG